MRGREEVEGIEERMLVIHAALQDVRNEEEKTLHFHSHSLLHLLPLP